MPYTMINVGGRHQPAIHDQHGTLRRALQRQRPLSSHPGLTFHPYTTIEVNRDKKVSLAFCGIRRSTPHRRLDRAVRRLAPLRSCTPLAFLFRRDACPLAISAAAYIIPAIVVMDETARAFWRIASGQRQAGGLIGQKAHLPKLFCCLARVISSLHLDTVEPTTWGPYYSRGSLIFFLCAGTAPPKNRNDHQQYGYKRRHH